MLALRRLRGSAGLAAHAVVLARRGRHCDDGLEQSGVWEWSGVGRGWSRAFAGAPCAGSAGCMSRAGQWLMLCRQCQWDEGHVPPALRGSLCGAVGERRQPAGLPAWGSLGACDVLRAENLLCRAGSTRIANASSENTPSLGLIGMDIPPRYGLKGRLHPVKMV